MIWQRYDQSLKNSPQVKFHSVTKFHKISDANRGWTRQGGPRNGAKSARTFRPPTCRPAGKEHGGTRKTRHNKGEPKTTNTKTNKNEQNDRREHENTRSCNSQTAESTCQPDISVGTIKDIGMIEETGMIAAAV